MLQQKFFPYSDGFRSGPSSNSSSPINSSGLLQNSCEWRNQSNSFISTWSTPRWSVVYLSGHWLFLNPKFFSLSAWNESDNPYPHRLQSQWPTKPYGHDLAKLKIAKRQLYQQHWQLTHHFWRLPNVLASQWRIMNQKRCIIKPVPE